ncbi:MAG: F0F1 ATP synthase subunit delta [Parvibaculales bacterium]
MSADDVNDDQGIKGVAGRYAVALFELSQDLPQSESDAIAADMAALTALVKDSEDLAKLLKSPVINAEEQAAALAAVLDKAGAHQLVKNFANLVISKRRAAALPDMAKQYGVLVAGARDEVVARVSVAQPLSDAQTEALKAELNKAMGKNIVIETETDADLLGGMIVKLGSRMIDGSLRTKLNSLKTALSQG